MQDVAQIGSSQFSVGFPLQAGPATVAVVNGVVHEHSRANALSLISRTPESILLKSLKEVKSVSVATFPALPVFSQSLWLAPGG